MTLVDLALLNAMRAERDAALAENARLRAAVEAVADRYERAVRRPVDGLGYSGGAVIHDLRAALAVPTADDGAERGAR